MNIQSIIPVVPNWPRPGVNFLDITALLENPEALTYCTEYLVKHINLVQATSIVAVESRGFPFAGVVCHLTGLPLIMARKKNKLPGTCYSTTYQTEYSQDSIEIQTRAQPGIHPLILDDLLATGGTVIAGSVAVAAAAKYLQDKQIEKAAERGDKKEVSKLLLEQAYPAETLFSLPPEDQIKAIEDSELLEISTQHFEDDSYREKEGFFK